MDDVPRVLWSVIIGFQNYRLFAPLKGVPEILRNVI